MTPDMCLEASRPGRNAKTTAQLQLQHNQQSTKSTQINPKNYKMSVSIGYRYNMPLYWSIGVNINHLQLRGNDADNKSGQIFDAAFYRLVRNLNFYKRIHKRQYSI